MSKTRKIRSLERQLAKAELERDDYQRQCIQLKKEAYNQKIKDASIIEDLEMLLLLHSTPANLQTQAG